MRRRSAFGHDSQYSHSVRSSSPPLWNSESPSVHGLFPDSSNRALFHSEKNTEQASECIAGITNSSSLRHVALCYKCPPEHDTPVFPHPPHFRPDGGNVHMGGKSASVVGISEVVHTLVCTANVKLLPHLESAKAVARLKAPRTRTKAKVAVRGIRIRDVDSRGSLCGRAGEFESSLSWTRRGDSRRL